jgi:hypothetical protein
MTRTHDDPTIDNRWRFGMLNLANRSILNKTFLADGVFSLIAGMVLIVDARPLAALAGPAIPPIVMAALGMGLLLWGAFHVISARKGGPNISASVATFSGRSAASPLSP